MADLPASTEQPTVLLLHGFLGCAGDWDDVSGALALTCRCISVDLPGHGATVVHEAGVLLATSRMQQMQTWLVLSCHDLQRLKVALCLFGTSKLLQQAQGKSLMPRCSGIVQGKARIPYPQWQRPCRLCWHLCAMAASMWWATLLVPGLP